MGSSAELSFIKSCSPAPNAVCVLGQLCLPIKGPTAVRGKLGYIPEQNHSFNILPAFSLSSVLTGSEDLDKWEEAVKALESLVRKNPAAAREVKQ